MIENPGFSTWRYVRPYYIDPQFHPRMWDTWASTTFKPQESWNPIFGQKMDWIEDKKQIEERLESRKEVMQDKTEACDRLKATIQEYAKLATEKAIAQLNQKMTTECMEVIDSLLKLGYVCNIKQETPTKISFEFSEVKKETPKTEKENEWVCFAERCPATDKMYQVKFEKHDGTELVWDSVEFTSYLDGFVRIREASIHNGIESIHYRVHPAEFAYWKLPLTKHQKAIIRGLSDATGAIDDTEDHDDIELVGVDPTDELPNSFQSKVRNATKQNATKTVENDQFEEWNENWFKLSEQRPDQYAIVNVKFTDLIGKEYTYYEVSLENCSIDSNKSIWITKPDYLNKLKAIHCSKKRFHCESIFIPVNTASWKLCGDIRNHCHSLPVEELLIDNQSEIKPEIKTPPDEYELQKRGFINASKLLPDENATVEIFDTHHDIRQVGNLIVWESEHGNKYWKSKNSYEPIANKYRENEVYWRPVSGDLRRCLPKHKQFKMGDYFLYQDGYKKIHLYKVEEVETQYRPGTCHYSPCVLTCKTEFFTKSIGSDYCTKIDPSDLPELQKIILASE